MLERMLPSASSAGKTELPRRATLPEAAACEARKSVAMSRNLGVHGVFARWRVQARPQFGEHVAEDAPDGLYTHVQFAGDGPHVLALAVAAQHFPVGRQLVAQEFLPLLVAADDLAGRGLL